MISADGGSPKLLLPDSPSGDPSWSRDGNQLAIGIGGPYSGEKQKSTITILDVKTGKVSTVPGSDGIFAPRWSPDGRFMAALSSEPETKKLLLYDFQSQKWKTWVSDDSGIAYPEWTTDGQYVQYRVGGENPSVWRVRLGESKPEMLFSAKDLHLHSGPLGVWSSTAPDNSVMLVRDVGSQEIYALDVDFP